LRCPTKALKPEAFFWRIVHDIQMILHSAGIFRLKYWLAKIKHDRRSRGGRQGFFLVAGGINERIAP